MAKKTDTDQLLSFAKTTYRRAQFKGFELGSTLGSLIVEGLVQSYGIDYELANKILQHLCAYTLAMLQADAESRATAAGYSDEEMSALLERHAGDLAKLETPLDPATVMRAASLLLGGARLPVGPSE